MNIQYISIYILKYEYIHLLLLSIIKHGTHNNDGFVNYSHNRNLKNKGFCEEFLIANL